ncbi:MAG: alpha/beta hydrolase [Propionibacteriaceae bacterium]|nr:MAG: alpha/beta hydrolase [Propionibacteriaceae bacterium]
MIPRRALRVAAAVAANYLVRVLVRLSPQRWLTPSVTLRLFRLSSQPGTATTAADVRKHQPARTWTTRTDLAYAPGRDGLFDLVLPDGPGPHPWVLWAHGGGWHFGSKEYPLPYVELLASRGFAGVVVNYPLAPRSAYPAAPRAVDAALAHILAHADEYGLDPDRVVLAGDSAGAQIAAEVATATTNPAYAAACGASPALSPDQLRGVLLFCGIYDAAALDDSDRFFEAGLESAMWSLSRRRDWKAGEACRLMSVREHVTAAFPRTFLAAGNADPLTRRQTPPMAARLRELGVDLAEYYPGDDQAPVNHEFQYWLGTAPGAEALERAVAFLTEVTRG